MGLSTTSSLPGIAVSDFNEVLNLNERNVFGNQSMTVLNRLHGMPNQHQIGGQFCHKGVKCATKVINGGINWGFSQKWVKSVKRVNHGGKNGINSFPKHRFYHILLKIQYMQKLNGALSKLLVHSKTKNKQQPRYGSKHAWHVSINRTELDQSVGKVKRLIIFLYLE